MKAQFKFIIAGLLLTFLSLAALNAQTIYFEGLIANDTIFEADTIKVTGDINVLNGVKLTIKPATFIEFQGYYKLDIQGCLHAIGNEGDSITFTVKDTTGFHDPNTISGGWKGIHFDRTPVENDTSIMDFCIIMYGKAIGDQVYENSGGAIYLNGFSKLIISNSRISNNFAARGGGGIFCRIYCSPFILNNRISNNTAYWEGGGIYIGINSNAIIMNNIITGNVAGSYIGGGYIGSGGGIYSSSANLNSFCPLIINNRVFNNISISGGGIYESNHNIKIINNLICNNAGGGILNGHQLGKGEYINNTICYNSHNYGITGFSNDLKIFNNIVWGNVHRDYTKKGIQIYAMALSTPTIKHCNVQNGYEGEGNIDSNPLFQHPTAGAGIEFNTEHADWSLQYNSPCINAGTPDTTGLNLLSYDILGNPRIFNGRIDIGAIENQLTTNTDELQAFNIILYPNPVSDKLHVRTTLKGIAVFDMYDTGGTKIFKSKLINSFQTLDLSSLPRGLFYYTITELNKVIAAGKIIKY
jgi:hypothetical protein